MAFRTNQASAQSRTCSFGDPNPMQALQLFGQHCFPSGMSTLQLGVCFPERVDRCAKNSRGRSGKPHKYKPAQNPWLRPGTASPSHCPRYPQLRGSSYLTSLRRASACLSTRAGKHTPKLQCTQTL